MKTQQQKPEQPDEKRPHLLKAVPDSVWLRFRVRSMEKKLSVADTLKLLLDSYKDSDREKKTAG